MKIKALLRSMAGLALPLLAAAFPILYLYGLNVWQLDLPSLKEPLGYSLLVAAAVYGVFFLLLRRPAAASLSATAFLIFYYTYGFLFRLLMKPDKVAVYHFSLLPLVIILAIYAGVLIARLKPSVAGSLENIFLIMSAALVVYNLSVIFPVEIQRRSRKKVRLSRSPG